MVGWRSGGVAAAILIALIGFALEDPTLLSIRRSLFIVLSGVAFFFGVKAFLARHRSVAAAFLFSGCLVAWLALKPGLDRLAVIGSQDPDARLIERHFIVGFDDLVHARDYVHRGHVGGIFITQRNVRHLDQAALTAMVSSL